MAYKLSQSDQVSTLCRLLLVPAYGIPRSYAASPTTTITTTYIVGKVVISGDTLLRTKDNYYGTIGKLHVFVGVENNV